MPDGTYVIPSPHRMHPRTRRHGARCEMESINSISPTHRRASKRSRRPAPPPAQPSRSRFGRAVSGAAGEYSLDASRWRVVYPKDGIPDSRREDFEVTVDESEPGRNVIIRATDTMTTSVLQFVKF